jgi:hypothetical protein
MNPIIKAVKALQELGWKKIWYYALYQIGLRSGHYLRTMPVTHEPFGGAPALAPYPQFPHISEGQQDQVLIAADQICRGSVSLFGGKPSSLDLTLGASSLHWSRLERSSPEKDIKMIWEPARFGWAITLARAYAYSGDPSYARFFWEKTLKFIDLHPPNLGRQWQSGQEVAIRLMVWIFCDRVLANAPSSSADNRRRLWQSIADHANRIPPTLIYAQAQNNNYLISEAAGLYTAAQYLPAHPNAQKWRQLGWDWLNWAFQNQIDENGTYVQHSVNYHRMMLQLAVFADHIRRLAGDADWPEPTLKRLQAATRWLQSLTDPETGRTPNLGANDGALIFPLSNQPFTDYRPTVDAAAKAFLEIDIYDPPALSEFADWLDLSAPAVKMPRHPQAPDLLRLDRPEGRAFLHTANYNDRPSHADQLHADLWWQGVNIALDPGTFQYNALPPWDNALASTAVHNTLIVDGKDQMQRAGRFLWLGWAQGEVVGYEMEEDGSIKRVIAEHDGYRHLGVQHRRSLQSTRNGWFVIDSLMPCRKARNKVHQFQLTWMLPDWKYQLKAENCLLLESPDIKFKLIIEGTCEVNLFRAGECIHGEMKNHPTWGWIASSYGTKQPALMVVATQSGMLPSIFHSIFLFNA